MPLEVNNCCFCVDLRKGCLIIGYLNLVWNIVLTGLVINGMVEVEAVADNAKNPEAVKIGLAILGISLLFVLVNLIFTVLLLVGIHKHKRGHVKAYLIYACIFIIFYIIGFFASIANGQTAAGIVQNLFTLIFTAYYLIVIRSYYLKMEYTVPVGGE